jgi:hypothetical protein
LDVLGAAGYYGGNALSFVFAVPEIYKTLKHGHYAAPVRQALLGMGASLALGLISAPLGGHFFWGMQNLFGALTIGAPLLIGKVLARRGIQLSGKASFAVTAAACAVLLPVCFGLYAASSTLLPVFLPVLIGKAGIPVLTLIIQVATGLAFFALFLPNKKKNDQQFKGFSSLVSLSFSISSFGFILWALQRALAAPGVSAERVQFLIYAVQNAVYAVVSWLNFMHSRKHEKKSQPARLKP